MLFFSKVLKEVARHKLFSVLVIGLLSAIVTGLDYLTPQEVPSDAFFAIPIWLGVATFGLWGGVAVSTSSIILFYIANYLVVGISAENLMASLIMNYGLFLLFGYGSYRFLQNQHQLIKAQLTLETRLKELDKLHQQTERLHQQNLKLAITEERNRLAREIHDVLAQGLLAIVVQVEAAFLNRNNPATLEERLLKIDELARYNLHEARRSVANLRPLPLDGATLWEALERRVSEFEREQQISSSFTTSGDLQPMQAEVETAVYRIAQEALSNVARHAMAGQVEVILDYDEEEVCLTIHDNGKGFEPIPGLTTKAGKTLKGKGKTFGLASMQERANQVGGLVTIQSKPGEGSRVRLIVPYAASTTEESAQAEATPALPIKEQATQFINLTPHKTATASHPVE
jgi:signal transduction histidine kinase